VNALYILSARDTDASEPPRVLSRVPSGIEHRLVPINATLSQLAQKRAPAEADALPVNNGLPDGIKEAERRLAARRHKGRVGNYLRPFASVPL